MFISTRLRKYTVLCQTEDVSAMSDIPGLRFQDVIDAAYAKTGRQVVILIDEYDEKGYL